MKDAMTDTRRIEERIKGIREWLKTEAPECFVEQKHSEEGTQERIYWHHGYMMGLRDALRVFIGDSAVIQKNHIQDTKAKSFSA
jgi:hypothetical protein